MNKQKSVRKTFRVTNRRQFKAWLVMELQRRGVDIPPDPTYAHLREAVEQQLPRVAA